MEDMIPQGTRAPHEGPGYEASDVGIRGIFIFTVILILVTVATMLLLSLWYTTMADRERQYLAQRPPRFADDPSLIPEPRLQGSPAADMVLHREAEDARLASYGWVDREAGIARIPIDRALELALKALAPEQPSTGRPAVPDRGAAEPESRNAEPTPEAAPTSAAPGAHPVESEDLPADPIQAEAKPDSPQ